jgi:hypothetical protein
MAERQIDAQSMGGFNGCLAPSQRAKCCDPIATARWAGVALPAKTMPIFASETRHRRELSANLLSFWSLLSSSARITFNNEF